MSPTLTALVAQYGYAAALLATISEGETVLMVCGAMAQRGVFDLPVLYTIGAIGAVLPDNTLFAVGRTLGVARLRRWPRFARAVDRANSVIARYPRASVIAMRFMYGTRLAGPAIIGCGRLPWWRFALLDAFAAGLWAFSWVNAGYAVSLAAFTNLS